MWITRHDDICGSERLFEKSHTGAIRFSIRRIGARSIIVSEVCTRYSLLSRRFLPSQAKLRSTIQVKPVILNARCRLLTIRSCHPWRCFRVRASLRLWWPASAITVLILGNNALNPPSSRAPARRSDVYLPVRHGWQPVGPVCRPRCDVCVPLRACARRNHERHHARSS